MTDEKNKPRFCALPLKRWVRQYNEVDFVWVSDHYDLHLTGICRDNGKLCRFETDYDTTEVSIFELSLLEKVMWLCQKKLFEWCVGYHWSYPEKKRGAVFGGRKPEWFWNALLKIYYW